MASRLANAGLLRAWGRADCAGMHNARGWDLRKEAWTEPRNALKESTGLKSQGRSGVMNEGTKGGISAPHPLPLFL
jgi:hypothetical protein